MTEAINVFYYILAVIADAADNIRLAFGWGFVVFFILEYLSDKNSR